MLAASVSPGEAHGPLSHGQLAGECSNTNQLPLANHDFRVHELQEQVRAMGLQIMSNVLRISMQMNIYRGSTHLHVPEYRYASYIQSSAVQISTSNRL